MERPVSHPILFAGDTHGNIDHWHYLIRVALANEVRTIIQVGDFGFWTHTKDGRFFLSDLSNALILNDLDVYWIDGNHESFERLYALPVGADGFRPVHNRITHIPRGALVQIEGHKVLGIGGAYSIDKDSRLPGVSWWPEELITQGDILTALDNEQPDIVVTHDVPESVPHRYFLNQYPTGETRSQRLLLEEVFQKFHPNLWVHGHYHRRYEYQLDNTRFIGLSCDGSGQQSWFLLAGESEMADVMESFWLAVEFSLEELGLSLDEIEDQAKTGEFESSRVEALWKIIQMVVPDEPLDEPDEDAVAPAYASLNTVPVTTGTGEPAVL